MLTLDSAYKELQIWFFWIMVFTSRLMGNHLFLRRGRVGVLNIISELIVQLYIAIYIYI